MDKSEAKRNAQKFVREGFFGCLNGETYDEDYHLLYDLHFDKDALKLKTGEIPFIERNMYFTSDYTDAISSGKLSPDSIKFSSYNVEDIDFGDVIGVKGTIKITIPFKSVMVVRNVFEIYYSILCAADKRNCLDNVAEGWFVAGNDPSSPEGYDLWYYLPEINVSAVRFEDNAFEMDVDILLYDFKKASRAGIPEEED